VELQPNISGEKTLEIEYDKKTGEKYDKIKIATQDEPAPEFVEAMDSLTPHLVELCEFPKTDEKAITTRAIHLSYHGDHDHMGIVMTGHKKMKKSTGILILNTPIRLQADDTKKANEKRDINGDFMKTINNVIWQAQRFLEGYREQTELEV